MEYAIDITDIVENFKDRGLPDPSLVMYYNQFANRCININCEIDDDTHSIANVILQFNKEDDGIHAEDRKPIKIFINSDGGDVSATLYVCDIIKSSTTPVWTIGTGKCYSGGGLILMAGHKRFIFDNTTFLLHDGYNGYESSAGKFTDMSQFMQRREEKIKEFVVRNSKIKPDEYDQNYRRDWFMLSDEIIRYGVADKVVTSIDEIL